MRNDFMTIAGSQPMMPEGAVPAAAQSNSNAINPQEEGGPKSGAGTRESYLAASARGEEKLSVPAAAGSSPAAQSAGPTSAPIEVGSKESSTTSSAAIPPTGPTIPQAQGTAEDAHTKMIQRKDNDSLLKIAIDGFWVMGKTVGSAACKVVGIGCLCGGMTAGLATGGLAVIPWILGAGVCFAVDQLIFKNRASWHQGPTEKSDLEYLEKRLGRLAMKAQDENPKGFKARVYRFVGLRPDVLEGKDVRGPFKYTDEERAAVDPTLRRRDGAGGSAGPGRPMRNPDLTGAAGDPTSEYNAEMYTTTTKDTEVRQADYGEAERS